MLRDVVEYQMHCQNAAMFDCSVHSVFTLKTSTYFALCGLDICKLIWMLSPHQLVPQSAVGVIAFSLCRRRTRSRRGHFWSNPMGSVFCGGDRMFSYSFCSDDSMYSQSRFMDIDITTFSIRTQPVTANDVLLRTVNRVNP